MVFNGKDWLSSDGSFLFGKYRFALVEDIARDDPGYLRWILDNVEDISDEDRIVIETTLQYSRRGGTNGRKQ